MYKQYQWNNTQVEIEHKQYLKLNFIMKISSVILELNEEKN